MLDQLPANNDNKDDNEVEELLLIFVTVLAYFIKADTELSLFTLFNWSLLQKRQES